MTSGAVEAVKLKPCPFCGGEQCTTAPGAFRRWFAVCKACGATANSDDGEDQAITAWNTRATPFDQEKHGDDFHVEYDESDDDFTVCWPDGRYLVAHRSGTVIVGQSPQSLGIAPRSLHITALASRTTETTPVTCAGCEGKPAPENNPCAVCGRTTEAEAVTAAHERLRIMAAQKPSAEMDSEDIDRADWQGAYDWFCAEASAIRAALTPGKVNG